MAKYSLARLAEHPGNCCRSDVIHNDTSVYRDLHSRGNRFYANSPFSGPFPSGTLLLGGRLMGSECDIDTDPWRCLLE